MLRHSIVNLRFVLPLFALLVAGCAGRGTSHPPEAARCNPPEALVCYGKQATRLGDRSRLEDVEFCRCERVDRF